MSQRNETPVLLVSLLVTIGLVGAVVWWLLNHSVNLSQVLSSPSQSPSQSPSLATTPTSPAAQTGQSTAQLTVQQFVDVANVPSGLFNYGGSTSWAPIRGQVDRAIQTALPSFQLRYTEPVTGTPGSSKGIRMLLDNQLSFAQSSRPLTPQEYAEAQQRGFTLKEIPVAIEGIAIAVHPSLNLPGLTLEQLSRIYTGQITNWNQVGGPNLSITPYSRRPEDAGTVEFFISNILGGQQFSPTVKFIATTTQALRAIAADPGGLYYASAPEVVGQCTTQPLPIGLTANALVEPYRTPLVAANQCPAQRNQINEAALHDGTYPITRRLLVIVKENGQADEQGGNAYANLLLTDEGQALLEKAGFVPIR